MPGRERCLLVAALLAACAQGCAGSRAPKYWLGEAADAAREPYGGWIYLERARPDSAGGPVAGELLAVSLDTVFLAGRAFARPGQPESAVGPGFLAVPVREIESARLQVYDAASGGLAALTAVGVLSTASNGKLAVGTAPMWLLGGSLTTAGRSLEPIHDFPAEDLLDWAPYARYPQGLPPGLNRSAVAMKRPDLAAAYWKAAGEGSGAPSPAAADTEETAVPTSIAAPAGSAAAPAEADSADAIRGAIEADVSGAAPELHWLMAQGGADRSEFRILRAVGRSGSFAPVRRARIRGETAMLFRAVDPDAPSDTLLVDRVLWVPAKAPPRVLGQVEARTPPAARK